MAIKKDKTEVEQEGQKPTTVPPRTYGKMSPSEIKRATLEIHDKHRTQQRGRQDMIQVLANYQDIREYILTGFDDMDIMMGGGIPKGIIIELYGKEQSGKSSLAYYLLAQNSVRGNVSIYIDAESKFTKERAAFWGSDMTRYIVVNPDTAEFAMDTCLSYSKCAGALIVVDSVPALMPKKHFDTYEKKPTDDIAGVALRARLINEHIWDIARNCKISGATVIFINQLRDKIGGFGYGEQTYTPGGAGLRYAQSMKCLVVAKEKLKKANEIYGIRVAMAMKKNQINDPFRTCELNLIFSKGFCSIETEKEDLDEARKKHLDRTKQSRANLGKVFTEEQIQELEKMNVFSDEEENPVDEMMQA